MVLPEFNPEPSWNEGALRRLLRDWYESLKTPWFGIAAAALGALAGVLTYTYTDDPQNDQLARAVVTSGGALAGLVIAMAVLFAVLAAITPYRQRNEAREKRDRMARYLGPPQRLPYPEVRQALMLRIDEAARLKSRLGDDPTERDVLELVTDCQRWAMQVHRTLERYLPQWNTRFGTSTGPQYPDMLNPLDGPHLSQWLGKKVTILREMVENETRVDAGP